MFRGIILITFVAEEKLERDTRSKKNNLDVAETCVGANAAELHCYKLTLERLMHEIIARKLT